MLRAYANIADEMEEAGYSVPETAYIKAKSRDARVIRRASGETIHLKAYEAGMRSGCR